MSVEEMSGLAAGVAIDLRALRDVHEVLGRADTVEQVAGVLAGDGMRAVRGVRSTVVVLDAARGTLDLVAATGYEHAHLAPFARIPLEADVPVAEAVRTRRAVRIPSVAEFRRRYPDLALPDDEPHSLVAVPLLRDGCALGAWGLRFDAVGDTPIDQAVDAGLQIGHVAASRIDHAATVAALRDRVAQLQHALDSRVLIEQAKGVLMGRHGVPADRAFEAIRSAARSSGRPLRTVAAEVVARSADLLADEPGAGAPSLRSNSGR